MKSKTAVLWWWIFSTLINCARSGGGNRELIVKTSNGLIKGNDNGGRFYSWESIPYAEPPVGELRFEAPQPYRHKWPGVFDATVKAPNCMQWDQLQDGANKLHGVEDCLTVSVYKPTLGGKVNYPVVAFIHGGCFMFGGVNAFEPDLLMASGKAILVQIAYRLGPLGFLSTEDEAIAGNFGLKDQQLALQWIKDNIKKFGGDPKKIMLMGFSAGGASAQLQMLQPSLKDTVKVAVSISGAVLNPWIVLNNARENALKLGNLMNCCNPENTQELKRCLQSQKAEDIVTRVKYFHNFGYNPFTTFAPVVEHKQVHQAFLTQHPEDVIKSGNFSHIPWLASYVVDEGVYNAAELLQINPKTGKEFMEDLNEQWSELAPQNLFLRNSHDNPLDYARQLREKYLGDLPFAVENYFKVQEMYTDVLFKDGILASIKLHSQHSRSPVYGYVYDNPADYSLGYLMSQRKDIQFGTSHIDDMSLILHSSIRSPPRPDEKVISHKLIQMLIDFVETGKLSYGDCDFENNAGRDSDDLKLMLITRDACESVTQQV